MNIDDDWSPGAQALLQKLRTGNNIGIPDVQPGPMAFNSHARAYLNNAAAICEGTGMSDYRIFMALYGIRHGIELWLKCVWSNELIDRALGRMTKTGSLEEIAQASGQTKKLEREKLVRALCKFRNVNEDKLGYPENEERNVGEEWANRAIAFMRGPGRTLPRRWFANLWVVSTSHKHDLSKLWGDTRFWIDEQHQYAGLAAQMFVGGTPSEVSCLDAIIEIFAALDPSGDAFRYPGSMSGKWFTRMPHMSLDRLGEMANELEHTVCIYDTLYDHAYEFTTVGSPWPHFDLL